MRNRHSCACLGYAAAQRGCRRCTAYRSQARCLPARAARRREDAAGPDHAARAARPQPRRDRRAHARERRRGAQPRLLRTVSGAVSESPAGPSMRSVSAVGIGRRVQPSDSAKPTPTGIRATTVSSPTCAARDGEDGPQSAPDSFPSQTRATESTARPERTRRISATSHETPRLRISWPASSDPGARHSARRSRSGCSCRTRADGTAAPAPGRRTCAPSRCHTGCRSCRR